VIKSSHPTGPASPARSSAHSTVLKFESMVPVDGAAVSVQVDGFATVTWCSVETTVLADEPHTAAAVQAVSAFQACYQSIQALRQPLVELEQQALADVSLCYCIEGKHKKHWPRLRGLMHQLARNRLNIVRVQSDLAALAVHQVPDAAALGRKLIKATRLKSQLAELSDRYEALEDLYEGAVDRINDHSYWRDGHVLEVSIIVVLLVEVLLLLLRG